MLTDHERKFLENWRTCYKDLERLHLQTVGSLLRSIKFRVMDRVIVLAGKNARFSDYDDNLFECCRQLMGIYSRAIDYYKKNNADISTISIKNLILDMLEVLSVRLHLFNDNCKGSDENPVAIERIKLLSAGVAYFMFNFNESEKAYNTHVRISDLAEQFTPEYLDTYINLVQNEILDSFMDKNYMAYSKAVQVCLNSLNTLRNRKALSFFYRFLTDEKETLSKLLSQTKNVEHVLSQKAVEKSEFETTKVILSILNEAITLYDSECPDNLSIFAESEAYDAPESDSIDSLRSICQDMLANSRLIVEKDYLETAAKYEADTLQIYSWLSDNANLFIDEVLSRAEITVLRAESEDRLKDLVIKFRQTAEAVACVFSRQVSFYREHDDCFSSLNENAILSGINETLMIKIETMAENIFAFEDPLGKITHSLLDTEISVNEKESNELSELMLPMLKSIWFAETSEDDRIVINTFYDTLAEAKPVADYRQRVSDVFLKEEERARKNIERFLKDCVLYEISTFEEILQYSVTRLRESDNDYVTDYIDLIDENAHIIESTLKKIGITMIRPKPHDYFNAKEHEVLMAERNESFAKGEVIKSITSGYKLDDQILIRANIIAAK